jgi:organic radical activating enzyme
MMGIKREKLYRFPWTKTDNPSGWVEVTDECDLICPGCYRHKLEGHRTLEKIKEDILLCKELTNCDRMGIAGGEPLIYPNIVEVVDFISKHRMKPMLLTNGEKLTWELANDLKKAGLVKFHFHVDSGMRRPDWKGKNEVELNELRQHYADLVWELGGIQCGYNVTVFPSTAKYLPDIVEWCQQNIHKVHHISLVAFRSLPLTGEVEYMVNTRKIDPSIFQHSSSDKAKISLTTEEMFEILENHFSSWKPCAYLNGTAFPETYKFLVTLNVGSKSKHYGVLGAKTVELTQIFFHLFKERYFEFTRNPAAGKKLFLLSIIDNELRKALGNFTKAILKNPLKLFEKIYIQSISLQQPNEVIDGKVNLCDSCVNMMVHKGKLINSCRLDEYRMFGDAVIPVLKEKEERQISSQKYTKE